MISVNRRTLYGEVYNDVRCLSSDEKPTEGIKNGSTLIEIDTGKRYLYDALSGSWNEFSQGGGGGGEYVLPTMSQSVKGGATLGEGLSMSGDSLSVDYSKVASKQSLDDATEVDPDGGLKRTTDGLSADYSKVASVESLESATKLEADGGIKRTSNGLSVDYSDVASVDALEDATAISPTGGIVSTQDGLAISPMQQSTGAIDGALLELTAKSKPATQATTMGKNLLDIDTKYAPSFSLSNGVLTNVSTDSKTSLMLQMQFLNENTFISYSSFVGDAIKTVTADIPENTTKIKLKHNGSVRDLWIVDVNLSDIGLSVGDTITASLKVIGDNPSVVGGAVISHIQLELGSIATSYEPYTGGAPSPSPDWPQPIVTVRGRNLFDISKVHSSITVDGSTITATAGSWQDLYDGGTGNTSPVDSPYIANCPYLDAGTYTVSRNGTASSSSKWSVYTVASDGSVTFLVGNSTDDSFTFTLASKTRVTFRLASSGTKLAELQLELGSTPTQYVPYGYVGLESTVHPLRQWNGNIGPSGNPTSLGGYKTNICPIIAGVKYFILTEDSGIYTFATSYNASTWVTYQETRYVNQKTFVAPIDGYVVFRSIADETMESIGVTITTPIPLPSRGWVAGLPDGTADELSVDGAGKVVWELETKEVSLGELSFAYYEQSAVLTAATTDMKIQTGQGIPFHGLCDSYVGISSATIGVWATYPNNVIGTRGTINAICVKDSRYDNAADFNTWLQSNPVTLLYPLATPVTENMGYVDLPDMQDCVLSIPELDALGVRYTIGDGAEIARQWYARAHSEYEQRITDLEEAVAELTAGA